MPAGISPERGQAAGEFSAACPHPYKKPSLTLRRGERAETKGCLSRRVLRRSKQPFAGLFKDHAGSALCGGGIFQKPHKLLPGDVFFFQQIRGYRVQRGAVGG